MDKNLEILKGLGLSQPEATAYITLLALGNAQATDLALEMNIKRTTAYPILERLISHELVTEYKRGRKSYYTPIRPNQLALLYEKKLQALSGIIPMLENMSEKNSQAFGVQFIQSKQVLKKFYHDILDDYRNQEYYIIGNASAWIDIDRDFFLDFRRKRAVRNIKTKLLLSHDSEREEGQNDLGLLRQFKYLPAKYNFQSTIDIYRDKIIIVGPEIKALAVVIAIPAMVDVFRTIFEVLWENSGQNS